jgi:hypothetical protein
MHSVLQESVEYELGFRNTIPDFVKKDEKSEK